MHSSSHFPTNQQRSAAQSTPFVLPFAAIDATSLPLVGGKGANLGVLTNAGFAVPPGFCITTEAYKAFIAHPLHAAVLDSLFQQLATVRAENHESIRALGEQLRSTLSTIPIPEEVQRAVLEAFTQLGPDHAYAVRSSATAEDLPGASFAGQQDTYLNVVGAESLLDRVRACWASLFTDRAIAYRAKNGFDHRKVHLSVVVQRLIKPSTAGIMFSADPVTGLRHHLTIDAGFGLGEALVSGLVNADLYKVDKRTNTIVARKIADKRMAIVPLKGTAGGTEHITLTDEQRHQQVLTDEQIIALATLGAAVEKHYGKPQDMEWCIEDNNLYIVQSRPITTLYPTPTLEAHTTVDQLQVFASFGHGQVMTDAMPTFATSVWRRLFPFLRDENQYSTVMLEAGNRLYLNPTRLLRIPAAAKRIPKVATAVDKQMASALDAVVQRPGFQQKPNRSELLSVALSAVSIVGRVLSRAALNIFFADLRSVTSSVQTRMDQGLREHIVALAQSPSTVERLKLADQELRGLFMKFVLPTAPFLAGGLLAKALLLKVTRNAIAQSDLEALDRGLPGNVTTEMDLRIGDLADVARQTPAVAEHLREHPQVDRASIEAVPGSQAFLSALDQFLSEYGMRGGSEIDLSRPRWINDSRPILQVIRGNLARTTAGSHRHHHEQLKRDGELAIARIAATQPRILRPLVRRLATAARAMFAVREHPKFHLIRTFWHLRTVALTAGEELARDRKIDRPTDVWHLTVSETIDACEGRTEGLKALIAQRAQAFEHHAKLTPPRIFTSEGEIVVGVSEGGEGFPPGALVGTGASAGVVEGIAKVVLDPNEGVLHAGEILIAPFTDPGWTPLFINAKGLVMEVGGMMTHGSVVAREYGIPAVVSVDGATKKIKTGQRVRVDGSRGYVEMLEDADG